MDDIVIHISWEWALGIIGMLILIAWQGSRRFAALETSMAWVKETLCDIKKTLSHFEEKLQKFESKLSVFEGRLSAFENRLSIFESKLAIFESKLSAFENKIHDFGNRLSVLERKFFDLEKKFFSFGEILHDIQTKTDNAAHPGYALHSPVALTSAGKMWLVKSGLKDYINSRKDALLAAAETQNMANPYEVQQWAFRSLDETIFDPDFKNTLEKFAYESGTTMSVLRRIAGIYLRDLYLEKDR